jgi:predicted acyl esterase
MAEVTPAYPASDMRDGMRVDWDVPIAMDDGLVLRADVFRPIVDGRHPVILTYGPYAKGLAFQDGYPSAWQRMVAEHPDVAYGSTNRHQNWETVDPEKWVPDGYVCVRVDSRGCGRSPGYVDHFSPRETRDFYQCIEWAGVQPWSNGKVGLNGVSYYGINQWHVASLQPPHLAARGGRGRLVPRHDASRRHPLHARANWYDMREDRPVRPRRARPAEPRHRRPGLRRRDAAGKDARGEPLRLRRRDPRAPARRRVSQGPFPGVEKMPRRC